MKQQPPPRTSRTARVARGRRLLINAIGLGVWLTGVLWLIFHYFLQVKSEFGPSLHPLEPWWLKLHGAFAFAALWTFGLLWGVHVANGWSLRRRRWSGGALFAVLLFLIITGYLLYYVGSDEARAVVSVAHWAVGLIAPLAYLAHRLAKVAGARRAMSPVARPSDDVHRDVGVGPLIARRREADRPTERSAVDGFEVAQRKH